MLHSLNSLPNLSFRFCLQLQNIFIQAVAIRLNPLISAEYCFPVFLVTPVDLLVWTPQWDQAHRNWTPRWER